MKTSGADIWWAVSAISSWQAG